MYMTSRQEACCSCPTCSARGDPAYQNTVRQIRAPEYPYSSPGAPLRKSGCATPPIPRMLSVANSLLSGEAERSLDLLRRAVMDNGIVCESIDEHTADPRRETPLPLARGLCATPCGMR